MSTADAAAPSAEGSSLDGAVAANASGTEAPSGLLGPLFTEEASAKLLSLGLRDSLSVSEVMALTPSLVFTMAVEDAEGEVVTTQDASSGLTLPTQFSILLVQRRSAGNDGMVEVMTTDKGVALNTELQARVDDSKLESTVSIGGEVEDISQLLAEAVEEEGWLLTTAEEIAVDAKEELNAVLGS